MKSRKKELEEEAKENNLTPTKDLEVDESGLSEEEKGKTEFPWTFLVIAGSIVLIMIVVIILIYVFGGPSKKPDPNNVQSAATSLKGLFR
ncbi:MAG: hypothetical protein IJQ67_05915 [Bacilli bacterium]|nr:hypothetical protein [Bacilli bacterium]